MFQVDAGIGSDSFTLHVSQYIIIYVQTFYIKFIDIDILTALAWNIVFLGK